MPKVMTLDEMMADSKRSGQSNILQWKDDGETKGFLHPKAGIYTRKVWWLPVWKQLEKVVNKKKVLVWQQYNEHIVSPNESRNDDLDPIDRFMKYLKANYDIDYEDVVYVVGSGKNKVEYTRGELLGGMVTKDESHGWKKRLAWKQEYLIAWVPTVKTDESPFVLPIAKSCGKKLTKAIEAEIEDSGAEKGNPMKNPYAFKLTFDATEKVAADMYQVRAVHNQEVDEDIEAAFAKDPPDLEGLATPTDSAEIYRLMSKYITIDLPSGFFSEWEGSSEDDDEEPDEADEVVVDQDEVEEAEEDDEVDDTDDEDVTIKAAGKVGDEVDFENMDRDALKAYIKGMKLGIRVSTKLKDEEIRERILEKLGEGTSDEPEAEDDEEDDTVEETKEAPAPEASDEEEDDGVELEDLDRKGLKALIKEEGLDVTVKKSMTEDDIRKLIEACYPEEAPEAEDDDEPEEAEDEEDDGVDLETLDRKGLKALIKENEYPVKVKKSMTEDDIRTLISEAAEAAEGSGEAAADEGDLDPCPACQKMISMSAKKCPYCKTPFE